MCRVFGARVEVTGEGGPGKAQRSCWSAGKPLTGLQQKSAQVSGGWVGTGQDVAGDRQPTDMIWGAHNRIWAWSELQF